MRVESIRTVCLSVQGETLQRLWRETHPDDLTAAASGVHRDDPEANGSIRVELVNVFSISRRLKAYLKEIDQS